MLAPSDTKAGTLFTQDICLYLIGSRDIMSVYLLDIMTSSLAPLIQSYILGHDEFCKPKLFATDCF